MLTEEKKNKLIRDLINKQSNISGKLMTKVAKEVRRVNESSLDNISRFNYPFREGQLEQEVKSNYDKEISAQMSIFFWLLAYNVYASTRSLYDYKNKKFISIVDNSDVYDEVSKIEQNAVKQYDDMLKNTVILTKSLKDNTLTPMRIDSAVKHLLNFAAEKKVYGKDFYKEVFPETERLLTSGIRVFNDKNDSNTRSLDSALENILVYTTRDIENKVYEVVGTQVEADGIELSAHQYPAPDHAPVQGRQFSNEEFAKMQNAQPFYDVKGNIYSGFERPIGAWNCRHIITPIVVGVTAPKYTEAELDRILTNNASGFITKNGLHKTLYECTQMQRRYEYNIRDYKRRAEFYKNCGYKDREYLYSSKARQEEAIYRQFSKDCGIPIQKDRLEI